MNEVGLELNADEATCVFVSRKGNVEQNCNIKTDNKSIEIVKNFKYSLMSHKFTNTCTLTIKN
jgi:hypothetical protein